MDRGTNVDDRVSEVVLTEAHLRLSTLSDAERAEIQRADAELDHAVDPAGPGVRVMPDGGLGSRPELTPLTDAQQAKVLAQVAAKRPECPACGNRSFHVGEALYVGFLFRSEPTDAYLVAITCTNPQCPSPRSGINLHASTLGLPRKLYKAC